MFNFVIYTINKLQHKKCFVQIFIHSLKNFGKLTRSLRSLVRFLKFCNSWKKSSRRTFYEVIYIYRTIYFICHWIGLYAIESYVILLDHILHFIRSDFILLDHTSFYRIIYFMSLDRTRCHCNTSFCQKTTFVLLNLTSCHWIVDHSIELYTSCHWIELHAIGSERSFDRASG